MRSAVSTLGVAVLLVLAGCKARVAGTYPVNGSLGGSVTTETAEGKIKVVSLSESFSDQAVVTSDGKTVTISMHGCKLSAPHYESNDLMILGTCPVRVTSYGVFEVKVGGNLTARDGRLAGSLNGGLGGAGGWHGTVTWIIN